MPLSFYFIIFFSASTKYITSFFLFPIYNYNISNNGKHVYILSLLLRIIILAKRFKKIFYIFFWILMRL